MMRRNHGPQTGQAESSNTAPPWRMLLDRGTDSMLACYAMNWVGRTSSDAQIWGTLRVIGSPALTSKHGMHRIFSRRLRSGSLLRSDMFFSQSLKLATVAIPTDQFTWGVLMISLTWGQWLGLGCAVVWIDFIRHCVLWRRRKWQHVPWWSEWGIC